MLHERCFAVALTKWSGAELKDNIRIAVAATVGPICFEHAQIASHCRFPLGDAKEMWVVNGGGGGGTGGAG